jgi:threonine dehydrogenase-like Zn-dependent dehydrogenase
MDRCKAAVFVGHNRPLEIQEFPIPEVEPSTGLIRMEMAAICGSDVHYMHNPNTEFPIIFGHENLGVIAELGDEITTDCLGAPLKEGDRVIFRPRPCGRCYECSMGEYCHVNRTYGLRPFREPPHIRGGFSQYVYLDPYPWLLRVPDEMSTERALLSVIGNHTVLHGIERIGGVDIADTVVVQGSGPIGMGALIQARAGGARKVIVIGAPANRLQLARELGADETVDLAEYREPQDRVERILDLTHGRGADFVIECSGADSAVQEGLQMVRFGGKYLVVGQAEDHGTQPINPSIITRKALRISGVLANKPQHIIRSLLAMNSVITAPVEKLITHQFPLEQINEAFRTHETLEAMIAVVRPNA